MGSRSIEVSPDGFSAALEGILNDIDYDVAECIEEPVRKCSKEARDKLRSESPKKTGRYAKGWSYTMKGKSRSVFGEVGNKAKPGLAHLLEKGHAKVGGGRVAAIPHIDPVAQEVFDDLESEISKAVGDAL